MDLLAQLLLSIGAFVLLVVLGAFIFITTSMMFDVIVERRQARERDKRRE